MSQKLSILLNEKHQANLILDSRGLMTIEYLDLAHQAISLSLPVQSQPYPNKEVVPFVLGLLPDNDWILKNWAKQYGTSTHPFHILSNVGRDCAGAVQFLPHNSMIQNETDSIEILDDDQIEAELAAMRRAFNGSTDGTGGVFSLAGAQPKITVFQHGTTIGRTVGRWPSTHIYKPTSTLDGQAENEYFCLLLAKHLGIPTAQTDIVHFGRETALISQRYDRICIDEKNPLERKSWVRIHQEDICQALGVPPSKKYQNQGGPTPLQIGKLLDRVSSNADEDKNRFADALFLNWLIAGTDGHAKNFAIIHMPEGGYRLAPLYDIVSARPYQHIFKPNVSLSMKVGDTYKRNEMKAEEWKKFWKMLGLEEEKMLDRSCEMLEMLPDAVETTKQVLHKEGVTHQIIEQLSHSIKNDVTFLNKSLQANTPKQPNHR